MFDLPLSARLATIAAFGYAAGCLNAGYYLVRARRRLDLRDHHSGNAGATNAGRVLGRGGFIAVLVLDAAKGALAASIGWWLAGPTGGAVGAIMAIAGHIWPAQLAFRGGKGIATAAGAFLVGDPLTVLASVGVALALFALSRRWAASGLVGLSLSPVVAWAGGGSVGTVAAIAVAAGIVLFAHRSDLAEWRSPQGNGDAASSRGDGEQR